MNARRHDGARPTLPPVTLLLLLSLALAGCGLFERSSDFDKVGEDRPLEIPPDLDRPERSQVMDVPSIPGQTASADGSALLVDDTVASTYRRVGLALERGGVEITARSESSNELTIDYTDEEAKEQRPGLFSRWILRRKGPEDLSGRYRLIVSPEGGQSAINVLTENGVPAPRRVAREILAMIEARLG